MHRKDSYRYLDTLGLSPLEALDTRLNTSWWADSQLFFHGYPDRRDRLLYRITEKNRPKVTVCKRWISQTQWASTPRVLRRTAIHITPLLLPISAEAGTPSPASDWLPVGKALDLRCDWAVGTGQVSSLDTVHARGLRHKYSRYTSLPVVACAELVDGLFAQLRPYVRGPD